MIFYLTLALLGCVVAYFLLRTYVRRHPEKPDETAQNGSRPPACGLTDVCELPCTPVNLDEPAEYFDDEELDRFRGRGADDYVDHEVEEFEEVMTTMRPTEVHAWLRSLQQRGIVLPAALKDAAYLLVSETREG
ncbi:MAG: hypothetical protein IJ553_00170 [Alloprevotella sp.]|nr:hypothetical protein [Alloprevotella sp.]